MTIQKITTYSEAILKLEKIVAEIEADNIEIDTLANKVKEAAALLAFCKQKLTNTEAEIEKILEF
jgi:exodeoxyribonuclease VII small subunit